MNSMAWSSSSNSQFQHGKVMKQSLAPGSPRYSLPTGGHIDFSFFPRRESDLSIKGGRLIGGADVAVEHNISANVLLVSDGSELSLRPLDRMLSKNQRACGSKEKSLDLAESLSIRLHPLGSDMQMIFSRTFNGQKEERMFSTTNSVQIYNISYRCFRDRLAGPVHS